MTNWLTKGRDLILVQKDRNRFATTDDLKPILLCYKKNNDRTIPVDTTLSRHVWQKPVRIECIEKNVYICHDHILRQGYNETRSHGRMFYFVLVDQIRDVSLNFFFLGVCFQRPNLSVALI